MLENWYMKEARRIRMEDAAAIPAGLLGWVNDYKKARIYGNVTLAKQIKANIDKKIKELGLSASAVYGNDPTPTQDKMKGQLWKECPRCGREPVCANCEKCEKHCTC